MTAEDRTPVDMFHLFKAGGAGVGDGGLVVAWWGLVMVMAGFFGCCLDERLIG